LRTWPDTFFQKGVTFSTLLVGLGLGAVDSALDSVYDF
jgi:hypothetical protein